VAIAPPDGVELVPVETALEMRAAVLQYLEPSTIIIKAAAVADYHLADVPKQKMKKTAARFTLDLDPTVDILAEVGQKKGDRLLIGFAAETQNLVEEARRKLRTKNCDMVVGNNVSRNDVGFGTDENEVILVLRTGENVEIPRASKRVVSDAIFDQALRLRLALFRHAAP
jgi:phosphopantothenoylcysteine decarboxylase/phosphopantothenate--cysteine ligase